MANPPGAVVDFTSWYAALANAVPWLFAGPHGLAESASLGQFADAQRLYLKQGIQQRFPDFASPDALPSLGNDRKLIQGPSESNANFQIRLKTVWGNSPITVSAPGLPSAQAGGPISGWALAGTWLQLLEELYWGAFPGAVIVQQNGLAYSLSGTPVAGADNHALLTITTLNATTSILVSSANPSRQIPAGTPWWFFDSNTDLCNRFAILFPGPLPSAFVTTGLATFTASNTASVTWNNPFIDTTYKIQVGIPTITDGSGPVTVVADNSTKTKTGVGLVASDAFTGTVSVLAWQAGANPYADLHPADLARLQSLIKTWRPNALCMGVVALTGGEMWDWPIGLTWDGDSLPWDQSGASTVNFLGVF